MKTFLHLHPLWSFFILAFSLTWAGSTLYYFAVPRNGAVLPSFFISPSAILWYYGPCLAAVIVTRAVGGKDSVRRLLGRFLQWRIGWVTAAFIVLYPPALHLGVTWIDHFLGGPKPVFLQAQGVPSGNPWLVLSGLVVFQVLVRGIGEETGWRGFALPALQSRLPPLSASLVLGMVWAVWHIHPANFAILLSPHGFFVLINITLTAILFSWVTNRANGSLLAAALFHMMLNVTEYLIPLGIAKGDLLRNLIQIACIAAAAGALVAVSGGKLAKELEK